MPIDSSSDPYDPTSGLEPVVGKFGAEALTDDHGGAGSVKGALDSPVDDDDPAVGGAISKVDPAADIDDDLDRAGTGSAHAAAGVPLEGMEKSALAFDDDLDDAGAGAKVDLAKAFEDDLDDAGSGAGSKGAAGPDDDLDKFDDADGFGFKSDLDLADDLASDPSLKGAVVADDFDDGPEAGKLDLDDLDDPDGNLGKGDFFDPG